MEKVLDIYEMPYDEKHPVVCIDEFSKQLLEDKTAPIPMKPSQQKPAVVHSEVAATQPIAPVIGKIQAVASKSGTPVREDYEYKRNGTRNGFMMLEPLTGWRHIEITEQRLLQDFAQQLKYLVDVKYKDAEKITLVCDNLSGHNAGALYATFSTQEAFRLMKKIDFCHTPKHASWLNMAEIEIAALQRQCLDRRIATDALLRKEVAAWEKERNREQVKIHWRFTRTKAHEKMHRLYRAAYASKATSNSPPIQSGEEGLHVA